MAKFGQVGAPDPELRNSPIIEPGEEATELPDIDEPRSASCYFNGEAFSSDSEVLSGETRLRCMQGSWIPQSLDRDRHERG